MNIIQQWAAATKFTKVTAKMEQKLKIVCTVLQFC